MNKKITLFFIVMMSIFVIGCGNGNEKLISAIRSGDLQAVKESAENVDLNKTNDNLGGKLYFIFTQGKASSRTPLYVACEVGDAEMIKYLLSIGADPNVTGYKQQYPLEIYMETNKLDDEGVLEAMIDAGVNLNLCRDFTPAEQLMRRYEYLDDSDKAVVDRQFELMLANGAEYER